MGRASRWFKALFGIKTRENSETEYPLPPRDKDRWLSGQLAPNGGASCSSPTAIIRAGAITPAEAAWLRSFYNEPDDEKKQHARAVAAATAAAADAAVAAAQAAAMVVHLTARTREKLAAAKIQAAFRGYLARRALRALKGLVKIQALTRGYLVRKEAAAALHSMQSLIRAQERVRARKAQHSTNYDENFPPARKSLENYEEHPTSNLEGRRASLLARNTYEDSPKIVEVDTGCGPKPIFKRASTSVVDPRDDNSSPSLSGNLHKCHLAFPNYNMVNQKVKKRSQSAPKERNGGFESNPQRRLTLNELIKSRNSYSGVVRTPRLSRRDRDMPHFKDALIGKLGRHANFVEDRV